VRYLAWFVDDYDYELCVGFPTLYVGVGTKGLLLLIVSSNYLQLVCICLQSSVCETSYLQLHLPQTWPNNVISIREKTCVDANYLDNGHPMKLLGIAFKLFHLECVWMRQF